MGYRHTPAGRAAKARGRSRYRQRPRNNEHTPQYETARIRGFWAALRAPQHLGRSHFLWGTDERIRSTYLAGRELKARYTLAGAGPSPFDAYIARRTAERRTRGRKLSAVERLDTPRYTWARKLWTTFRLEPIDWALMWEAQRGLCAICQEPMREDFRHRFPCVDHDHKTNRARGLLCSRCNGHLLSQLERIGPAGLDRALAYLKAA